MWMNLVHLKSIDIMKFDVSLGSLLRNTIRCTLLICFCVCTTYTVASIESELQQLPQSLAEDLRSAIELANEKLAKESDPETRADIIGQLAIIYHAQQMLASAEQAYLDALDNHEVYSYRYLLAVMVLQRGDTAEAVAHLEQVVLSNPSYVPAWYRLGNLELLRGNLEKALESFENAQKVYPDSAAILVGLASVKIEQQDWSSAIEYLEKAWVYEPNNGQIAYKLVSAFRGKGDEESANLWVNRADSEVQLPSLADPLLVELASMSRNAKFFAQAANWAFRRGDRESVRGSLLQATRLEPDNLEYALKFAAFLELVGEIDAAADELKRVLAIKTNAASAWYALARLFRNTDDGEKYVQGLVAVQKAVEIDDDEAAYRTLAAAMSLQATLYPHAQEQYMQLIERHPENPYYYYWFGLSRLIEGNCDGREALKRAVLLRRSWGEAHVALARSDAFCGDIDGALNRLDALAKAAADTDIQSAQAYVALLQGDTERALFIAEQLLPDPDAKMIVEAIESGEKPNRMFSEASRWWIPPELLN